MSNKVVDDKLERVLTKVFVDSDSTIWSRQSPGRTWSQHTSAAGYKFIVVKIEGKSVTAYVQRLVGYVHKRDSYFEGAQANHLDGDRSNNDATNIEWASTKDNALHRVTHGVVLSTVNTSPVKAHNTITGEILWFKSAAACGRHFGTQGQSISSHLCGTLSKLPKRLSSWALERVSVPGL